MLFNLVGGIGVGNLYILLWVVFVGVVGVFFFDFGKEVLGFLCNWF